MAIRPPTKQASKRSDVGVALITGASGEIGAVYADRLARRGYDLILVARDLAKLEVLANRLHKNTGRRIDFMGADLATFEGRHQVGQMLEAESRATLLLNSAGVDAQQPLIESDVNRLCKMIQLNVVAVTHLARVAASVFVSRGQGVIINIASVAAFTPELLNGAYAASKSFVLTLSQSLHHELAAKGVQVQAVLPGTLRIDPGGAASAPLRQALRHELMSADEMVDAALLGLDRREWVTIPSLSPTAAWDHLEAARRAMASALLHPAGVAR